MLRACLLATLALLAPVRPAAASAQDAEPLLVAVASMSPWVDAQHGFTLRLRFTNTTTEPIRDVLTTVSVRGRVITRSALRSALDGTQTTGVIASFSRGLGRPIPPGAGASVTLREPLGERLTERGPYPLTISVTHSAGSETLYTVLPAFGPTDVGPLTVSLVLRADAPSVPYPFGGFTPEVLDTLGVGPLTSRLEVLARRIGTGVTFAPSPALVEVLARLAEDGIATVSPAVSAMERAIASVAEVATVPYAPIDLPAVARASTQEALLQIARGRSVVQAISGREPSTATVIPRAGALDATSLGLLSDLGASATLLDRATLAAPPVEPAHLEPDKFGALFAIGLGDGSVSTVLPDPDIAARLATGTGVLGAQAVIAETLGVWQELPLFAPERIVLLAPERIPGPTMLEHLIDGLRSARWVRMRPLSGAITGAPPSGQPSTPIEPRPIERPYLDAALRAREALDTLTAISVEPPPDLDDLERAVLLAAAEDWVSAPDEGIALAAQVEARLAAVAGNLGVAERRVTLTSRTGTVPLTLVNDSEVAVRALIQLSGSKLRFPDGERLSTELAPGDNTISIPVEVLGTGALPLEASVLTPTGDQVLASGTIVIRSTALSAVSLAVVAGSGVFLLGVWARRARRRGKA